MASYQLTQIDNGDEAYIITGNPELDTVLERSRDVRIPTSVTLHHNGTYNHQKNDTVRIDGTLDIQK